MKLREYQENIINWLRYGWNKFNSHLIQAPTGAGKTVIAGAVVKGLYDNGFRVLFTVPRTALIDQTIKSFKKMGINEIGVQQANHEMTDIEMPVQIGTVQTLARRGYSDYDVLIVDECHIRSIALLEFIKQSDTKVIGLTATPYANWLGEYYQNFIKRVTMAQLMEIGFLCQYEFYAPSKPDLKGVKTTNTAQYGSDYNQNELAEIMGDAKIAGDIITTWLDKGRSMPTIAFCCNVLHANFLTVEFKKNGVNAEVVTGETPHEVRARIYRDFADGIIQIICSVEVLVEGFDSDVRCIIYAKPTKSEARWVQAIGRGMRIADGKEKLIVLDHSGTVLRLGKPHEIEYDELFRDADGLKQAQKARVKEKKEKTEKECPSCHYIKPINEYVCSKCGFKPIFGQDGEVNKDLELKALQETPRDIEAEKKFYNELCGYWQMKVNEGKNWKKGWIAHKFKEKYGDFPDFKFRPVPPSAETSNYIKYLNIKAAKSSKNRKEVAERGLKNLREMLNAN